MTFSFDATARVVWLDDLASGAARAGDLCTRHADALVPPQGWSSVDRRIPTSPPVAPGAVSTSIDLAARPNSGGAIVSVETDELLPHREPKRKRKRSQRWSDVPSLFDDPTAAPPVSPEPPVLELVDSIAEPVDVALDPPRVAVDPPDVEAETSDLAVDLDESASSGESITAWEPRFDVDDLGGLLDAKSPLLSRAFRAAKTADTDTETDDDEIF